MCVCDCVRTSYVVIMLMLWVCCDVVWFCLISHDFHMFYLMILMCSYVRLYDVYACFMILCDCLMWCLMMGLCVSNVFLYDLCDFVWCVHMILYDVLKVLLYVCMSMYVCVWFRVTAVSWCYDVFKCVLWLWVMCLCDCVRVPHDCGRCS